MTELSFGVMHDFRQPLPWKVSTSDYYAECLGLVQLAEHAGFRTSWLSEHHGTDDGFLPAPLIAATAIAARTTRMTVATNVLLLPLHHPLRVAEEGAVLHALSGGRFLLGVGQGYAAKEFAAFGVDRRQRPSRFEEGLRIIRQAWREGRAGFDGRRYQIPDMPFEPRADVPIYVGATAQPSIDRAVQLADGLVTYVGQPDHLRPRYEMLRSALTRHGRSPETFGFAFTGIGHVHEDADQAWAEAAPGIAYLESAISRALADDPAAVRPIRAADLHRADFLVGTPAEVSARLASLRAETPFDHFAFWGRLPGLSVRTAAAATELFAAKVIPALRP